MFDTWDRKSGLKNAPVSMERRHFFKTGRETFEQHFSLDLVDVPKHKKKGRPLRINVVDIRKQAYFNALPKREIYVRVPK